MEPYLDKIKIISLGIRLSENIPHVGPNHLKQGEIAAGLMSNLLREREKILIIDNGDDKVSSKLYLEGFMKRISQNNLEIEGPIEGNGIDESVKLLEEKLKAGEIKGLYINRYSHDILDRIAKESLNGLKIVTNGIGKIIKKLIREKIITLTVMEEIASEGYVAGKRMFEILYKEKNLDKNWDVSKSHIIFYENLED